MSLTALDAPIHILPMSSSSPGSVDLGAVALLTRDLLQITSVPFSWMAAARIVGSPILSIPTKGGIRGKHCQVARMPSTAPYSSMASPLWLL